MSRPRALHLLAPIADLHAEPPALEGHPHAPELVPRHFLTVCHEQRHSVVLRLIPFNPAACRLVGNLRAVLAAHEMLDGQTRSTRRPTSDKGSSSGSPSICRESTTFALDAPPEVAHEPLGLVVGEIHERHGDFFHW